jgi:hypothetical protein
MSPARNRRRLKEVKESKYFQDPVPYSWKLVCFRVFEAVYDQAIGLSSWQLVCVRALNAAQMSSSSVAQNSLPYLWQLVCVRSSNDQLECDSKHFAQY